MRGVFVWTTMLGNTIGYADAELGLTADIDGQPVEDLIRIWLKTD